MRNKHKLLLPQLPDLCGKIIKIRVGAAPEPADLVAKIAQVWSELDDADADVLRLEQAEQAAAGTWRKAEEECSAAKRFSADKRIELAHLLAEARDSAPPGTWESWVETNIVGHGIRDVQRILAERRTGDIKAAHEEEKRKNREQKAAARAAKKEAAEKAAKEAAEKAAKYSFFKATDTDNVRRPYDPGDGGAGGQTPILAAEPAIEPATEPKPPVDIDMETLKATIRKLTREQRRELRDLIDELDPGAGDGDDQHEVDQPNRDGDTIGAIVNGAPHPSVRRSPISE